MNKNKKNNQEKLENFFDNFVDERYIPSYKNLVTESKKSTTQNNDYFLNIYKMYEENSNFVEVKTNQIISGVVSDIKQREYVVNIGYKDMVYIDRRSSEEKVCKHVKVGDRIDVLIVDVVNNPFIIKGSVAALIKYKVESRLKSYYDNITPIDAYVKEMIPAGYLLDILIDGITIDAFMPNTLADVNKLHDNSSILGEKIQVALESLQQDKDKGVYVVSRKKYLKSIIPDKINQIKKNPKDTVYTGHVTGVRDYGIFVQFEGYLTGMIHKANIREDVQEKIMDIPAGTLIDFYIKDIVNDGKIILTQLKTESLWDTIRVSDKLKGKVFGIKPYGVLVELDYETSGLIQTIYTNKCGKTPVIGEIIDVAIVAVARDERKIYLTYADDQDTFDKLKEKYLENQKMKQQY